MIAISEHAPQHMISRRNVENCLLWCSSRSHDELHKGQKSDRIWGTNRIVLDAMRFLRNNKKGYRVFHQQLRQLLNLAHINFWWKLPSQQSMIEPSELENECTQKREKTDMRRETLSRWPKPAHILWEFVSERFSSAVANLWSGLSDLSRTFGWWCSIKSAQC